MIMMLFISWRCCLKTYFHHLKGNEFGFFLTFANTIPSQILLDYTAYDFRLSFRYLSNLEFIFMIGFLIINWFVNWLHILKEIIQWIYITQSQFSFVVHNYRILSLNIPFETLNSNRFCNCYPNVDIIGIWYLILSKIVSQ